MIENWMNNHLVSDSICNTMNLGTPSPPKKIKNVLQGMTIDVGLTYSDCDTILRFTISIEQELKLVTLNIVFSVGATLQC